MQWVSICSCKYLFSSFERLPLCHQWPMSLIQLWSLCLEKNNYYQDIHLLAYREINDQFLAGHMYCLYLAIKKQPGLFSCPSHSMGVKWLRFNKVLHMIYMTAQKFFFGIWTNQMTQSDSIPPFHQGNLYWAHFYFMHAQMCPKDKNLILVLFSE